jgi:hypothetical protein
MAVLLWVKLCCGTESVWPVKISCHDDVGVYGCTFLLSVATLVFLLNNLGCIVGTDIFYVLVTDWHVILSLGVFCARFLGRILVFPRY